MRKKRFLASLLALLMLFSLLPAAALAEDTEEAEIIPVETEEEVTEPVEATEPEADEPEALPEPETDEPEADPVEYDLWVCGVQVTSSNKGNIVKGVSFDPDTATLTINGMGVDTFAAPAGLYNRAVIYSELPSLTILTKTGITINSDEADKLIYVNGGSLTVTTTTTTALTLNSASATYGIYVAGGDLNLNSSLTVTSTSAEYGVYLEDHDLNLGIVFNRSFPRLTFNSVKNGIHIGSGTISAPTTAPVMENPNDTPKITGDTVQNAVIKADGNVTFEGLLTVRSTSAAYGIYAPNGDVINNGNLSVVLDSDGGCCIFVGKNLTSSGPLNADNYNGDDGYGVKVMDGDVNITPPEGGCASFAGGHCGLYCANGDVTINGKVALNILHNEGGNPCVSSGIYTANGSITTGAVSFGGGANWVLYGNGPIHITEGLTLANEGDGWGGNGIKSTTGGITIDGNATITAINGLDAGESTEGILVNGDLTINASGKHGAIASNGPITVHGNLNVRGAMYAAVYAKGDVTVEGDAYASGSAYQENPGYAMYSTDGSIIVTKDLSCYGTKNPAFAKNDIRVGGNALFSGAGDFGAKAENGEITVHGTLTCKGNAAYSVWAGTNVTVDKDVTVTNAAEGSVGMYAVGFLTVVSGKWDVSAGAAALQAGNGIVMPEGYGVTLPEHGKLALLDSFHTVTEKDGSTVAAHAVIEEKEAAEGYYLIRPNWTFEDIHLTEKFEPNPDVEGEYILNATLSVGEKIKVVKVTNDEITDSYPEGYGTEYTVDQAHAGTVNIRFKTTYDSDWAEFGGFMFIEHVHTWKVTWNWAEDYSSATATFTCEGDPTHTQTLDAVVTVDRWSECDFGTYVDYTATVEFEGKTYKDYKYFEYPNGHPWGEPTWVWAEDYSTATAKFVCTINANHTKTLTATVTSEIVGTEKVYTATVTLEGLTYTDTKTVSIGITVSFDQCIDGVEPETIVIPAGGSVETLPTPTRTDGWVFVGWYTAPAEKYLDAGKGTPVTTATTFDANTTVYAHWRLPGDVNGDAQVNFKDLTRLQRYLKYGDVEVVVPNLDVNGDGTSNFKDLTRLQRYLKYNDVDIF